MRKIELLPMLLMLIVLIPGSTLVSAGTTAPQQAAGCATYQTNLIVDYINSVPHQATVGDTIVTTFHVIYPDGTPVTLSPPTASFNWMGPTGQTEFDNVPVAYNGTPGFYNYTQPFTQDIVTAAGSGTITISVVFCSCQDGVGNRGPTGLVSSVQTPTPIDDSLVSTTSQPQTLLQQLVANYTIPALIIVLIILALLALVLRRRRKKKT